MVSRTFFAGALAALSARAVVAGPCRPVSSSTVQVSYSSAATDSTSAAIVPSSTETLSTETLSTETETVETSLTVPTTDVTTSTVIQEATATTTEGLTTTELTTSDATSYQTTETTIVESETTTASETTTTAAETTTTASLPVPTTFKLISEGGTTNGLAVKGSNTPSSYIFVADNYQTFFTYESETGQLSSESLTLCVYREDSDWNAVVKTCSMEPNERDTPLLCEKPTNGELKCRVPGAECEQQQGQCPPEIPDCPNPNEPTTVCTPTGEEWSQFFVRAYLGNWYTLHLGIENPSTEQNAEWHLQPIRLQIEAVDN